MIRELDGLFRLPLSDCLHGGTRQPEIQNGAATTRCQMVNSTWLLVGNLSASRRRSIGFRLPMPRSYPLFLYAAASFTERKMALRL